MALFALRFLIGCQAEEKIGNEMHNHVQDGVEVSYLKGEEANIARQKLISKLQSENTIEILESTPIALRTNEGFSLFQDLTLKFTIPMFVYLKFVRRTANTLEYYIQTIIREKAKRMARGAKISGCNQISMVIL